MEPLKPKHGGDNEELANTCICPFTTFNQVFNNADNVGILPLRLKISEYTTLKPRVLEIMRQQRTIHPDDQRAIGNRDLAESFEKITGLFDILKFVGFFVGALVLMSGVIGISNIMLIVVKERTKEIGVRRALGATPWDIRAQVLQESLVLTILSGMVGVAFSAGGIWIMNYVLILQWLL